MASDELGSSELGTLEYWEDRYEEEIGNFRKHGDVGEIWFGEDILDRLLRWITSCSCVTKTSNIVDIGCGNGVLLTELANSGFVNLLGVDYSEKGIVLAKEIAKKQDLNINYAVGNVLEPDFYNGLFDVVLDKGTYDAVSLSTDSKRNREAYIDNVYNCLKQNGLLILTSCNFTKCELDAQFNDKFSNFDVIPTPQFKFGGKIGSVVTCVVYKKM